MKNMQFDKVYYTDGMGVLRAHTMVGVRSISMVGGVLSKERFNAICGDIMRAQEQFESAMCDPDADFDICMSKCRRILHAHMKMPYVKYAICLASECPRDFQKFLVFVDRAITDSELSEALFRNNTRRSLSCPK